MVLLSFENNEDLHTLFSDGCDGFGKWLVKLKPWAPGLVPKERTVWVRVWGVPAHAWKEDFFTFLSQLVGRFEGLDEATKKMSRLDVGKVQVTLSSLAPINKIVKIKIDSIVYSISLLEEVFVETLSLEKGRRNLSKSYEGLVDSYSPGGGGGGEVVPWLASPMKNPINRWGRLF